MALKVTNLGVEVPDGLATKPILSGVSFEIQEGEWITWMGPSGAGKSTLLRSLGGLQKLSQGTIQWKESPWRPDGQVALVSQNPSLFPHLNVLENLEIGLKWRKVPCSDMSGILEPLIQNLRIEELLHRMPIHLSGGEMQRVALARALAIQPRLLLLDEPMAHLPESLRDELRTELLYPLKTKGVTTILVTHDHQEALSLGDQTGMLVGGKVQQVGSPATLWNQPASPDVMDYLNRPSISLIPGEWTKDSLGRTTFCSSQGWLWNPCASCSSYSGSGQFGFRAQDWQIRPAGMNPGQDWKSARIQAREWRGDRVWLKVQVDSGSHMVDLPASLALQEGQEIDVQPLWERAIWFPSADVSFCAQPTS